MTRHSKTALAITTILAGLIPLASTATEKNTVTNELETALTKGKPYIDIRYRFENVDQDGFTKDANASTVRTKLGYETGNYHDFSALLELENVSDLNGEHYNNTVNGKTHLPVVADPEDTEINRAFVTYKGIADTVLRIGRQDHNLDNQRFIGTVSWRQNDQMYDSAMIVNTSLPHATLIYSYVDNVNRVFSDDHPLGDLETATHVINASYEISNYGKLTGYGYLIDLEDPAVYSLSSKTFGLRFTGSRDVAEGVKALYTAEVAQQSDYANNPTSYTADYYLVEGGTSYKNVTAKLGFESLGSDNGGTVSFQTPLATLHAFNGWADKFLTTPAAGLEDIYGSLSYQVSGVSECVDGTKLELIYHDFSAESGGADYGTEWNAQISQTFREHYTASLKYADYDADGFATDTRKFWFTVGVKF